MGASFWLSLNHHVMLFISVSSNFFPWLHLFLYNLLLVFFSPVSPYSPPLFNSTNRPLKRRTPHVCLKTPWLHADNPLLRSLMHSTKPMRTANLKKKDDHQNCPPWHFLLCLHNMNMAVPCPTHPYRKQTEMQTDSEKCGPRGQLAMVSHHLLSFTTPHPCQVHWAHPGAPHPLMGVPLSQREWTTASENTQGKQIAVLPGCPCCCQPPWAWTESLKCNPLSVLRERTTMTRCVPHPPAPIITTDVRLYSTATRSLLDKLRAVPGSVWRSSPKTGKRPQLDRTGPEKDRTSSLVFWILRIKTLSCDFETAFKVALSASESGSPLWKRCDLACKAV